MGAQLIIDLLELTNRLKTSSVTPQIVEQVQQQKRRLGAIQTKDFSAHMVVDEAFVGGFRLIELLASVAAVSAAATATVAIRSASMLHESRRPSLKRLGDSK
jgi:hypothetical protein